MMRAGLSLVELMLTIAIIAVLASGIILAVQPKKAMDDANLTRRLQEVKDIENGINQYLLGGNTISGLPTTLETAKPICRTSVTGTDCTVVVNGIDLSGLVGVYMAKIHIDPAETTGSLTGYNVWTKGQFPSVCSPLVNTSCGSSL